MHGIERLDVSNPTWMKLASSFLALGYIVIGTLVFFSIFCLACKWRDRKNGSGRNLLEFFAAFLVIAYVCVSTIGQIVMSSHGPDLYGWAIGQDEQDEKIQPMIEDMGNFFVKEYLSPQVGEKKVQVGDEISFTMLVTKLVPLQVTTKQAQANVRKGWMVEGHLPENPSKMLVAKLDVDNNLKDPEVNRLLEVNFKLQGEYFGEGYVRTRSYLVK